MALGVKKGKPYRIFFSSAIVTMWHRYHHTVLHKTQHKGQI